MPNEIETSSYTANVLTFIYSEKATQFCEISTVDLSYVVLVKSTVEISQNFVVFSEYKNFIINNHTLCKIVMLLELVAMNRNLNLTSKSKLLLIKCLTNEANSFLWFIKNFV